MLIIHGFAKAKMYDLESDKIISAIITDRSGKQFRLPVELYDHLLKKMNKYFRRPCSMTMEYNYGTAQIVENRVKEVSFTYGEHKLYAVISIKAPSDIYNKGIGTSIVVGRLRRANNELIIRGTRDKPGAVEIKVKGKVISKGILRNPYKKLPDFICELL